MRKLILHIGAPKCGSSALQSYLLNAESSHTLQEYGFKYPVNSSRGLGHGNSGALFNCFSANSNNINISSEVLDFLNEAPDLNLIISDEMLYGLLDKKKLNLLASSLKDNFSSIDVLLATRSPSRWMVSDYSQHIKTKASTSEFVEHVVKREAYCEWASYVHGFMGLNPLVKFHVCDFKNVVSAAEYLLGMHEGELIKHGGLINENKSMESSYIEALRLCGLLKVDEDDAIRLLSSNLKHYSLVESNSSLLAYLDSKTGDYFAKIRWMPHVKIYE